MTQVHINNSSISHFIQEQGIETVNCMYTTREQHHAPATMHVTAARDRRKNPFALSRTTPLKPNCSNSADNRGSIELNAALHRGSGGEGSLWLIRTEPHTCGRPRPLAVGHHVKLTNTEDQFLGRVTRMHTLERDWAIFTVLVDDNTTIFVGSPHNWAHTGYAHNARRIIVPWSLPRTLPSPNVMLYGMTVWKQVETVAVYSTDKLVRRKKEE